MFLFVKRINNFFKKELIDDNDIQRTLLNDLGISIKLNFENNYQLIVAVILSAQCTDKRVKGI